MQEITTYLNFDGNCHEAMKFYAHCFGGELSVMRFGDAPMDCPESAKDRVMHARITKESQVLLMASDTMVGMAFHQGNNFSLSLNCASVEEADRLFTALSEGGKVTMPLQETFWATRFGMVTDRFGISWMCNFEKPVQMPQAERSSASARG